jgi:hypothetical protein
MTASGSVLARATLRKESLEAIQQMIWLSVNEAFITAAARIEALQKSAGSQVPIRTGALRESFKVAISPGQIIMHWSAIDKGFDYALIQDIGGLTGTGGTIRPNYYSDVMKEQAKQIVHEELMKALRKNLP